MNETSIDKLVLDILVKNENATRRLNATTKALEKFYAQVEKFDKNNKFFDKLNNISPTSTGGGKTSNGGTNKTSKNLNIFATLGKWNYMINMARYYGKSLANIVQLSMDYVETQNLWQVANRNNLEMADEFIAKMNKAYGVSEATLMNYQAIFKNMLSALGDLSDEISSGLSMQLTQMALDFSSLYNVTIPSAMQKFQAVLSGQVRPIRSVSGYDITENTIFDLYVGAGGEKTMRQLSQIEKRLLRIVAVFDQMGATGATGDMAKTIESASNQARIMSEQAKETLMWAGQLVLMWLQDAEILQTINAFLITTKEIIRSIAYDMGYTEENFLQNMVFGAEEAGEAIDEIQGKLLSFDKFESLNSNQSNVLGIDQTVLDLLNKINYQTSDFKMKSTELSEIWLDALDFIDKNGDGIRELSADAIKVLNIFRSFADVISSGWEVISDIFEFLKPAISWLLDALSTVWGWLSEHKTILAYIISPFYGLIYALKTYGAKIINGFASMISKIANFFISFINVIIHGLNLILKPLDIIARFFGKRVEFDYLKSVPNWQPFPAYATGGFPEDGLFFANQGEMVGQFSNGKTAVANNDQIVTGITQGVYNAMMAYNAQTRGQGGVGDVYLDKDKVGRVVAKGSHSEMVRVGLIKANI